MVIIPKHRNASISLQCIAYELDLPSTYPLTSYLVYHAYSATFCESCVSAADNVNTIHGPYCLFEHLLFDRPVLFELVCDCGIDHCNQRLLNTRQIFIYKTLES